MRYFTFPKWLKRFYPGAIWDFSFPEENGSKIKTIYLTFDDGPNPETTAWILAQLARFNAKATFFCLGKNVEAHPQLFNLLQAEGHQIGNHGYAHLNGAVTTSERYISDVEQAQKFIPSILFRPAYGKLKPAQYKALKKRGFKTVFWSYITYDFDASMDAIKRVEKAQKMVKDGSIVVFHDSDKAFPQLKAELPVLLDYWAGKNYVFKAISGTTGNVTI